MHLSYITEKVHVLGFAFYVCTNCLDDSCTIFLKKLYNTLEQSSALTCIIYSKIICGVEGLIVWHRKIIGTLSTFLQK